MKFTFSTAARKDMHRLPAAIAERVHKKLQWFTAQKDPLYFAEPLKNFDKIYRFRIGDYRAIFTVQQGLVVLLVVLAIKDRKEAYRAV